MTLPVLLSDWVWGRELWSLVTGMILIGSFENVFIGTKTPEGQSSMRCMTASGKTRLVSG